MAEKTKKSKKRKVKIRKQKPLPIVAKEVIESAIFAPVSSLRALRDREAIFDLGKIKIKVVSNLTQTHKNILYTVMALAYRDQTYGFNRKSYTAFFSCRWGDLLKRYQKHDKWLWQKLEEIRKTTVSMRYDDDDKNVHYTLDMDLLTAKGFATVNDIKDSVINTEKIEEKEKEKNPGWFQPKYGDMIYIIMSPTFLATLQFSRLRANYSLELIDQLRQEKSTLQAIIEYIITQKVPFSISLEKLIDKVFSSIFENLKNKGSVRVLKTKIRKEITSPSAIKALMKYNIEYDPRQKIFRYRRQLKSVGFSTPAIPADPLEYITKAIQDSRKNKKGGGDI